MSASAANRVRSEARVILPLRATSEVDTALVPPAQIDSVICHRLSSSSHEQYLVKWKAPPEQLAPHSWHYLHELEDCLVHVQQYIDKIGANSPTAAHDAKANGKRRRDEDDDDTSEHCSSRSRLSSQSARTSPAPSTVSSNASGKGVGVYNPDQDVYFGTLDRNNGQISVRSLQSQACTAEYTLPTSRMIHRASRCETRTAQYQIRAAFDAKLAKLALATAPLDLHNDVDGSRPPLSFNFIRESVLGAGVERVGLEFVEGCGFKDHPIGSRADAPTRRCQANMGQNMGCEYARVCDCLEWAAVDESSLTPQEKAMFDAGEMDALPKRFPYQFLGGPGGVRVLQPFYLNSRHPIYECNQKCQCGPHCKTRLVQKGRTVPLQIFKTKDGRGWGLRCKTLLKRGQFIDTYRGEIITDAESTRREQEALSGLKSSYLYSLDKFVDDISTKADDCYVVDGETMGGATRFINHSCEPNVAQYTVSYNKYDRKVYEIAFFARRDIRAMEELTFDYQDKDDDADDTDDLFEASQRSQVELGQTALTCRCRSKHCRGTLWL